MLSNELFEGAIDIAIEPTTAVTRAHQKALTDAWGDGSDVPQEVRFACRIAMDVNTTIADGVQFEDGRTFVPNPQVRAQFGKNRKGLPYLTFGLLAADDSAVAYTLTWEGTSVPIAMLKAAIAHDEGVNVKAITVALPFEKANVHQTKRGSKGKGRKVAADGVAPRRKHFVHSRVCRSDLEQLESLRKVKAAVMTAGRG